MGPAEALASTARRWEGEPFVSSHRGGRGLAGVPGEGVCPPLTCPLSSQEFPVPLRMALEMAASVLFIPKVKPGAARVQAAGPGAPEAVSTQLQGLQAGHTDTRTACPWPPPGPGTPRGPPIQDHLSAPISQPPRPRSPDTRFSPSGALEWGLDPPSGEMWGAVRGEGSGHWRHRMLWRGTETLPRQRPHLAGPGQGLRWWQSMPSEDRKCGQVSEITEVPLLLTAGGVVRLALGEQGLGCPLPWPSAPPHGHRGLRHP